MFVGTYLLVGCGGSAQSEQARDAASPGGGEGTGGVEWDGGKGDDDWDDKKASAGPSSTLTVDGVDRAYRLFVPDEPPAGSMSLLVAVHGGGGRDYPFVQQTDFEQLAQRQGIVVVYPLAELLEGNEGEWQLNADASSRQDLDFIEALIDDVSDNYPVDPARVYATGYSLGSMFVYELACHLSTRFAAVASQAGTMPVSPNACDPQDPVAIMHIHGVDDPVIPYGETWDWKAWDSVGTMMDIPGLVSFWSERYGCQGERETASESSSHIVHDTCDQNVRVELHSLTQGGHAWPDSIEGLSTHELVWSFLSDFSKP